jgi:OOP family OmpA-OmpF porin
MLATKRGETSMRMMMAAAAATVMMAVAGPVAAQEAMAPAVVYFERSSETLNAAAREVLDEVARQLRTVSAIPELILAGHADVREGKGDEAVGLSQQRASMVREYLIAAGVPADRVRTMAFGHTRPAYDGSDPVNRRVEITFAPTGGW